MSLSALILSRVRQSGPLTAAEFIELALYHPEHGYYSTAARRSGRRGDFITSVDIGPLFGEMLALQFEEMWRELGRPAGFDLVEAGAGDGRLARDVLDAAAGISPEFYRSLRVTLVERSAPARAAHAATLGRHAARLVGSGGDLPDRIEGAIYANELLDAMPPHIVLMTAGGLREIVVTAQGDQLREALANVSTPRIQEYLDRTGMRLAPGERRDVPLQAAAWIRDAARRLERGFLLLIDYGVRGHAAGAVATHDRHTGGTDWLRDPGTRDITAHVNLTALTGEAERAGLVALGATDQTHFLLSLGIAGRLSDSPDAPAVARRRAATTLLLPEGLGGTQQVLAFAKMAGLPRLRGLDRNAARDPRIPI